MGEAPSDALRDVYERRAELQYASPVPPPNPRVDRKFDRIIELTRRYLPAESLLDAGCGDGRFLAAIAQLPNRPARLAGTDISERILKTAEQALARVGATAELERANLERLPFADASFDRVLCVQVIEHLLDPAAGISELARVLEPGGILVVSTDNAANHVSQALNLPRRGAVRALRLTGRRARVSFPHVTFTRVALVTMLEAAGLDVQGISTFKFHVDGLDVAPVKRVLNLVDRNLPAHEWGDIIAAVARKPL